jgi:hypothetical protein
MLVRAAPVHLVCASVPAAELRTTVAAGLMVIVPEEVTAVQTPVEVTV